MTCTAVAAASTTAVFTLGNRSGGKVTVSRHKDSLEIKKLPTGLFHCFSREDDSQQIPYSEIISVCVADSEASCARSKDKKGFSFLRRGDRVSQILNTNLIPGDLDTGEAEHSGDSLVLHYASRPKPTSSGNVNHWFCQSLILKHSNPDLVSHWKRVLSLSIAGSEERSQSGASTSGLPARRTRGRPKYLLVFVNPYGGARKARRIFKDKVRPLFDLANIKYEVIETERANHAHDTILGMPTLEHLDGIVCVGGDGMFNELFNALLHRTARENGQDVNDSNLELIKPGLRVGVIPAGSTDAIAIALHGTRDVETATLHIILGDSRGVDAARVYSDKQFQRFAMTMVSYGYFGDLLRRSEKYRWLGPKRYDLSGAQTILANQSYQGLVGFVKDSDPASDPITSDYCSSSCSVCARSGDVVEAGEECRHRDPTTRAKENHSVSGKFLVVTGASLTCANKRTPKGVSPR